MRALELQDFGLMVYWYQAAFKDKKPTRKDKAALYRILNHVRAYTKQEMG